MALLIKIPLVPKLGAPGFTHRFVSMYNDPFQIAVMITSLQLQPKMAKQKVVNKETSEVEMKNSEPQNCAEREGDTVNGNSVPDVPVPETLPTGKVV